MTPYIPTLNLTTNSKLIASNIFNQVDIYTFGAKVTAFYQSWTDINWIKTAWKLDSTTNIQLRRKYIRHILSVIFGLFTQMQQSSYWSKYVYVDRFWIRVKHYCKKTDYFLQINNFSNIFRDAPRALRWGTFQWCSHRDETAKHKRLSSGWRKIWHSLDIRPPYQKDHQIPKLFGCCYFA